MSLLRDEDSPDILRKAVDRYGVWPTTVWTMNHNDPFAREVKKVVGDDGSARGGGGKSRTGKNLYAINDGYISIVHPAQVCWAINFYAPEGGMVYDPFAGGGSRAILSCKAGLGYQGCELRKEEVKAIKKRLKWNGVDADIRVADATDAPFDDNSADFGLTCPPYWNLEKYDGGDDDLSMVDYGTFEELLLKVAQEEARILKPGSYSVWRVGLTRHKDGEIAPINLSTIETHKQAGFKHMEEAILFHTGNGSTLRVGMFDKGRGTLIRTHEYVEVFCLPNEDGSIPKAPRASVFSQKAMT